MVAHYQIIEKTDLKVILKVNQSAYTASLVRNSIPKGFIAFTTNYSWAGLPIGHLLEERDGKRLFYFGYPSKGIRPRCKINQFEFEAGPLLVDKGINQVELGLAQGKFRPDAIRRTTHIAIGFREDNKLIIVFMREASMHDLANELLRHKVKYGIKVDGGSKAVLKIGNTFYKDERNKNGAIIVGVQLNEKVINNG
jgi:hypothetical protein